MTSRPSPTDATDATDAAPPPAESHPAHTFTLYASGGRVYVLRSLDPRTGSERALAVSTGSSVSLGSPGVVTVSLAGVVPSELLSPEREQSLLYHVCEHCVLFGEESGRALPADPSGKPVGGA
jgi:hypothetical protein